MFSCQICVEYDGIRAAVHVMDFGPWSAFTEFGGDLKKKKKDQDVVVKYVNLILLFAIYIVQDYISW